MKKTLMSLVAICAIGVCALAGCEGGGKVGEGFAISNKAELQEEWPINGGTRQITFTCDDEEFNPSALISSGDLVVESSDTDVVSVVGSLLYPMSVGKAEITATYGKHEDSVEVSISEFAKVIAPYEVDQQYYLGAQDESGDWKYIDGGVVSEKYFYEGTTTYYLEDAVLVTLEDDDSGEGYYLSFTKSGVKYYIAMHDVDGYLDMEYTTTPSTLYWNAEYGCFEDADSTVYLGYYNTYECSYACQWKYWGSNEPPLLLYKPGEAVESDPWECPAEEAEYITSIEAGTYHLGLYSDYSKDTYGTYYFTGSMAATYYGGTSQDVNDAVEVTVAEATGDTPTPTAKAVDTLEAEDPSTWTLSFSSGEDTKYIGVVVSDTHYNFTLVDAETEPVAAADDGEGETWPITEFTWDETYYCFTVTINETTRFLGTYGSYTTFGWYSYSSIANKHEYPGRLYAIENGEGGDTGDGGNTGDTGNDEP